MPSAIPAAPTASADPRPTPLTTLSTTALVQAARDGAPGAWPELIRRYQGLVGSVVAAHRLQDADAADAVQNTWLRAVERLDSVQDPDRLGGWLRTTARRECIELLRRSRRETPTDTGLEGLVTAEPGPEAAALDSEAHAVVGSAIARLPGRRRELIRAMFYRPDSGYAEMSREIDIPIGSIGPTRRRALRSLHLDLVRSGYLDTRVPA